MSGSAAHNDFKEQLPAACPPDEAIDKSYDVLFRFVPDDPPTEQDFYSHAKLGKPCPSKIMPCRWASCSLFKERPYDLVKLPRLRSRAKHFVLLEVPEGAGLSVENGIHVDFWMFAAFDPLTAVIDVEQIDG